MNGIDALISRREFLEFQERLERSYRGPQVSAIAPGVIQNIFDWVIIDEAGRRTQRACCGNAGWSPHPARRRSSPVTSDVSEGCEMKCAVATTRRTSRQCSLAISPGCLIPSMEAQDVADTVSNGTDIV